MSRILIIYASLDPPTELAILFLNRLSQYINSSISAKSLRQLRQDDVDNCDILISIRTQNYFEAYVANYAKQRGKLYCLVLDDDFLAIPDYLIRRTIQYKSLMRCITLADAFLCGNDTLGKKLESLSPAGKYVRGDNTVDKSEIKEFSCDNDNIIKIVYYVNDGSLEVYYQIVDPLIQAVRSVNKTPVEWHFIGIKPDIKDKDKEIIVLYDHMSLQEFKSTLRNSNFSFGIAPLPDTEFCRGKYINKFIEYTCAGLPCIYSNVEPYSSFVRNGVDGILTGNSLDEWVYSINKLTDLSVRKGIVENAQQVLLERMSFESVYKKMIDQFPAFTDYKSREYDRKFKDVIAWKIGVIQGRCSIPLDLIIRIRGRLKCEGLRSLLSYSFKKLRGYIR